MTAHSAAASAAGSVAPTAPAPLASLIAVRRRWDTLRVGYLERPFTSVQLLLVSGGILLVFGVMMAVSTSISSSLHGDIQGTIWTQVESETLFVAVGLPVLWLGNRITPNGYRSLVYPVLLFATILMLAVFAPGVGVVVNGVHRWLRVGPVQIQPSEFAKLAMLLWGADLLARKDERRTMTSYWRVLVPLVPGFAAMGVLVMAEPDLGTTLCFVTILIGLLWTVGLPLRYFAGMLVVLVGAVTALAIYSPMRRERLTSFLHPGHDAGNTGHQALQGFYALAGGGPFGAGLGSGTAKYWVPNASTDYVFAIIGDELGLLGCLAVLGAFGLFAYAALRVARRSESTFIRLAASGTAVWICGQALINIGYVTGLLPVTGIPLPFVSAGGTSLVLTMGVLGMLLSFARHEPAAVLAAQEAAVTRPQNLLRRMFVGVARAPRPVPSRVRTPHELRVRTPHELRADRNARPERPAPRGRPSATAPRRSAPVRSTSSIPPRSVQPRATPLRPTAPRPAPSRPVPSRAAEPRSTWSTTRVVPAGRARRPDASGQWSEPVLRPTGTDPGARPGPPPAAGPRPTAGRWR